MNLQLKTLFGILFILAQIVLFRDFLPFLSTKVVVKGMACTCPDAEVINGRAQLRTMTPDSLKKYHLDYSEIYFEEGISTPSDLMGVSTYMITGEVIGKKSISEGDQHAYPLFRITRFTEVPFFHIISVLLSAILVCEPFVLYRLIVKQNNRQNRIG